uniref:von Willebrand factor A domain containing 3B n=1 Tax=Panthera tigris altaica TaxID=74533 RepID=A0A8C9KX12_PANTA
MELADSSSTISEQQLQGQERLSNTKTDLAGQSLISSEEWLQLHGLKSKKLTLKQILSQIGFPHCEDYVSSLGRLVASRYADGLFPQFYRPEDGRVYNGFSGACEMAGKCCSCDRTVHSCCHQLG